MSNGVFNFNILALLISEILGGSKFTLGVPTPPGRPLSRRNFCTQSEYFTISNCVFNFNILALVVSDILGGLKFMLGGLCPCTPPSGKKFCTRGEYFTMCNGICNFNFLALVFSEILGGPKFTLGGPTPPGRPLAEKFFYPKRVLTSVQYFTISNCVFNFNILDLVVFELLGRSQIYVRGPCPLYAP